MSYSIIGFGAIGSALACHFAREGTEVLLANSRGPASLKDLVGKSDSLTLHSDPASTIYPHQVFAYDASKTALNAFTVHLAHEPRDTPIKVNSAHPGWVRTGMGGEGADLDILEGGETSAWLATLPADGPTGGYLHLGKGLPW
jgi:NAD(P)-dependent dehydrogenase (short-subunit alcohol dehydrogenase family)